LPVVVRFVEGQAVVTHILPSSDGAAAGLRVGDSVEAIDGVLVTKLVEDWTPYYAASNEPTRLRDIGRSLTNGPAGPVRLRVRRDGASVEVTGTRVPARSLASLIPRTHDLAGEAFRLLSKDVAYLKLSAVKDVDLKECIRRAAGTKGFIIDIRNYPSEFVVFKLGSLLVDRPTEFVRFTIGSLETPGAFNFTPPLKLMPQDPHYAGRVVILVDEISQSQSEYTTIAFRVKSGAVVIGSTTAGADGNLSTIPLPGGLRTAISGIGVFYPDKTPTQRVGIIPDVEVRPTLAGIKAGRDEVLEEALRQILGPEASVAGIRTLVPVPANVTGATPGN
jgi:C-terminal processing protease CtpA/Prc